MRNIQIVSKSSVNNLLAIYSYNDGVRTELANICQIMREAQTGSFPGDEVGSTITLAEKRSPFRYEVPLLSIVE